MSDVAHILGEFIAAWNSGQRPRLGSYLERVPSADRDELGEQIETFLLLAPEPEYDERTWDEMTAHPSVASVAAASMAPEPWPSLLPRLRERAGLTVTQLAGRLGLAAGQRSKAARMLEQMEAGELDPRRPSRPLIERLGAILGVSPSTLDWRGGGPVAPAPALYRSTTDSPAAERLDLLADALLTDADEWDEVDELFLGGRE
jgi:transcriptional regulator with XRE-family HTH domain